jgi:hypothetical protein
MIIGGIFQGNVLEIGKVFDRFGETHFLMLLQELNYIARLSTAKTLINSLGRADTKAGRLLLVKGATPFVVSPDLF